MKKYILLFLLVCLSASIFSQKHNPELYFSADSFTNGNSLEIKRARLFLLKKGMLIKTVDNKKMYYAPDQFWGFKNKRGEVYRYYKGSFYSVKEIGNVIVYCSEGKSRTYYFSKGLDRPIFSFSKGNIMEQFGDNPCFVKKLEEDVKWHQGLSDRNKKTGHQFRFTYLYNECKDGASGQAEVSENF